MHYIIKEIYRLKIICGFCGMDFILEPEEKNSPWYTFIRNHGLLYRNVADFVEKYERVR